MTGHWFVIMPNMHALTVCKFDDTKDSFCEKVDHVFVLVLEHRMEVFIADFSIKLKFQNQQLGMRVVVVIAVVVVVVVFCCH
jgi:hypothetical protein